MNKDFVIPEYEEEKFIHSFEEYISNQKKFYEELIIKEEEEYKILISAFAKKFIDELNFNNGKKSIININLFKIKESNSTFINSIKNKNCCESFISEKIFHIAVKKFLDELTLKKYIYEYVDHNLKIIL